MSDPFAQDWARILSVTFTLIPAVYKYRGVLAKVTDLIAEGFGFLALVLGLYLYTNTLPQIQTVALQLSSEPSPGTAQHLQTLDLLYFGSIGLMVLGGLVSLFGLIGRLTRVVAPKTPLPPKRK